ncbi:MAG: DUF1918 domain-containing protein, partial [Rhodococcus sp. (in: high G+C Gram-positive bacteria)]
MSLVSPPVSREQRQWCSVPALGGQRGGVMRAEVGDRLHVQGQVVGQSEVTAEVLE